MSVKLVLNPQYKSLEGFLYSLPTRFEDLSDAELLHDGRNKVMRCRVQGVELVIKSFGRPFFINRWVYGSLRRSKAMRAYYNGMRLMEMNFLTPKPIAAIDVRRHGMLESSFFISLYSDFKPLTIVDGLPEAQMKILIDQLAEMLVLLHDMGIEHRDLNPANIRYQMITENRYAFELIDNNRMAFRSCLNLKRRLDDLRHFSIGTMPYLYLIDRYADIVSHGDGEDIKLRGIFSRIIFNRRHEFKVRLKSKLKLI